MNPTDDLQLWSLVLGALLPPFIAVIQQPTWPKQYRAIATVVVCALGGCVTAYLNHEWSEGGVTHAILITTVAAMALYRNFWKPIGAAPAIEASTALDGAPAGPQTGT